MNQNLATWNKILIAVVATLLLLSVYSFTESTRRAERFERGQKLLPQLNPDEVAEIRLVQGEKSAHLRRSGDGFVVVDAGGYPASNDAVNRLLRDVVDLGLEKKVGRGDKLREELELLPDGESSTVVTLTDAAGKPMVRFVVGKTFEGGGNYVERLDGESGEMYLTTEPVFLSTASSDYVQKEILDVPQSDVTAIRGGDFELTKEGEDGVLALVDVPAGKKPKSSQLGQLKGVLGGLRFTEHHLANAPEVRALAFADELEVQLADGSGYRLAVAESDGKHYLKIIGFHQTERVEIAMDATEDEVRDTSEILVRADEIAGFNELHGSWIYEVSEFVADKVRMKKADLLEDA